MRQNKNELGFIPMIILIVIVLGALIWVAYHHVSNTNKTKDALNNLRAIQQNANSANR